MILRRVTEHVRSQNWLAVGIDLVVVVVGVFLGLQVTQWNEDRADRRAERDYIDRLISDLGVDIDGFDRELRDLELKEASLARVQAAFRGGVSSIDEPGEFLGDIVEGSNRGWNQIEARQATFNELIGSGRLNLIRDTSLRVSIADYYQFSEGTVQRMDERESQFPSVSYQLIARSNEADRTFEVPTELDLAGVVESELVDAVFESDLRNHVIAEINFSRFVRGMDEERHRQASVLVELLEDYRSAIN